MKSAIANGDGGGDHDDRGMSMPKVVDAGELMLVRKMGAVPAIWPLTQAIAPPAARPPCRA
jgi:hypothetical protein